MLPSYRALNWCEILPERFATDTYVFINLYYFGGIKTPVKVKRLQPRENDSIKKYMEMYMYKYKYVKYKKSI